MKKSTKAALLSGLVFPGAGHCSLRRFQRGLIFFLPALLALLLLAQYSINRAYAIIEQLEQGTLPLDAESIARLLSAPPSGAEQYALNVATWLLLVCWAGGIVDAYRLGKAADDEKAGEAQP